MTRTMIAMGLVAATLLGGCASNEPADPENPDGGTGEAIETPPMSGEDQRARTDRRLSLDRALKQWTSYRDQQEYATADGIARHIERHVESYFDEVVDDVENAGPRFRSVAAGALGFSERPRVVPVLVDALRDGFREVVLASLASLWRAALNGHVVPTEPVVTFLNHPDSMIRSNAALVLSKAAGPGDGGLFLPLTGAMTDEEPRVRLHAAAALGALGEADAIPFLLKGLEDPKVLVRIRSAYALGRIGERRSVPGLVARLDDPDEDASKAVYKALMEITGQSMERYKPVWEAYLRQHESDFVAPEK